MMLTEKCVGPTDYYGAVHIFTGLTEKKLSNVMSITVKKHILSNKIFENTCYNVMNNVIKIHHFGFLVKNWGKLQSLYLDCTTGSLDSQQESSKAKI